MNNPNQPNRFDMRNVFLGPKWNIFVVIVGTPVLAMAFSHFWNTFSQTGWWPVIWWALVMAAIANSVITSAIRLWRMRKAPNTKQPST